MGNRDRMVRRTSSTGQVLELANPTHICVSAELALPTKTQTIVRANTGQAEENFRQGFRLIPSPTAQADTFVLSQAG